MKTRRKKLEQPLKRNRKNEKIALHVKELQREKVFKRQCDGAEEMAKCMACLMLSLGVSVWVLSTM